jgi:hypothetical protein
LEAAEAAVEVEALLAEAVVVQGVSCIKVLFTYLLEL